MPDLSHLSPQAFCDHMNEALGREDFSVGFSGPGYVTIIQRERGDPTPEHRDVYRESLLRSAENLRTAQAELGPTSAGGMANIRAVMEYFAKKPPSPAS